MKLVIDIPKKEFAGDIADHFQDFFKRVSVEIEHRLIFNDTLLCGNYELETAKALLKSFKNATLELEQKPCEDCISRQAVHEMLENVPINPNDKWFNWLQKACLRLADLPSVQPKADIEPKTGHWIMHIDDLFPVESTMECSECGEHQPLTISDSYCPNCGAKMEGEESYGKKIADEICKMCF